MARLEAGDRRLEARGGSLGHPRLKGGGRRPEPRSAEVEGRRPETGDRRQELRSVGGATHIRADLGSKKPTNAKVSWGGDQQQGVTLGLRTHCNTEELQNSNLA